MSTPARCTKEGALTFFRARGMDRTMIERANVTASMATCIALDALAFHARSRRL